MIGIASYITAFFEQHLPFERRRSEQTRDSYAYAFKLFLRYASQRLKVPPSQLALEQIDAPLVVDFLNDLETTRHNGPSSRNARLAAIKSFMHFLEFRVPSALERIRQILAIPAKHAESRLVRHLTTDEMQAILDAPDPTIRSGVRDRAMLHLCYAAALRVSELIDCPSGRQSRPSASRQRADPWERPPRAMPPLVENDHHGAASVAGGPGTGPCSRTLHHRARRLLHAIRFRVHSRQARQDGHAAMPDAGHETRISARRTTHVCVDRPAGHEGPAEGLPVAGACTPTHHRNLHTGGSIREARGARIGGASEPALGALQSDRSADRVSDVALRYAERHTRPVNDSRGLPSGTPHNSTLSVLARPHTLSRERAPQS